MILPKKVVQSACTEAQSLTMVTGIAIREQDDELRVYDEALMRERGDRSINAVHGLGEDSKNLIGLLNDLQEIFYGPDGEAIIDLGMGPNDDDEVIFVRNGGRLEKDRVVPRMTPEYEEAMELGNNLEFMDCGARWVAQMKGCMHGCGLGLRDDDEQSIIVEVALELGEDLPTVFIPYGHSCQDVASILGKFQGLLEGSYGPRIAGCDSAQGYAFAECAKDGQIAFFDCKPTTQEILNWVEGMRTVG